MNGGYRRNGEMKMSGPGLGRYWAITLGVLILAALYLISLHSFLLFHCLVEIFSVVIAFGIFLVAWNSRQFLKTDYLLFVGIAYLFVAGLDVLHTLAYKGMGVFPGYDADLPTQLWIATRYLQSCSLLIAPIFFNRKVRLSLLFVIFSLISVSILASIFSWGVFPDCFVEGRGLTSFKKTSEYLISLILLGALGLLTRHRAGLPRRVFVLIAWSIGTTIGSELAFTFYVSVYGLSNLVGHLFKVMAFYLMYKAIVETGLREPYALLFRELVVERDFLGREVAERRKAEEALTKARDELEQRVDERTAELSDLNKELAQDITERKIAEEALRESEERFRQVFEQGPIGMGLVGIDQRFHAANTQLCRMLGYAEDEIKKLTLADITHPDHIGLDLEFVRQLRAGEIPCYKVNNRYIKKDGGILWGDLTVSVIRDAQGGLLYTLPMIEDITARKRSEDTIQEQNEFLKTVLESLTHPFYVIKAADYTIELANSAAAGCGIEENSTCYAVTHGGSSPCTDQEHLCPLEEVKRTGQSVVVEHLHTLPTGEFRHVEVHGYPILDKSGNVSRMIEYTLDVTGRRRAEEFALHTARFRAISDLASGVAHNFNNLLQIIMGSAGVALLHLQSGDFSDMKENLEQIVESCKFGTQTVRRLNRFAKSHDNARILEAKETFELSGLVKQAVEMARPWWKTNPEKRGIKVDLKTTLTDGCLVRGSSNELFEVIVNLIKNATEALADGGQIEINTRVEAGQVVLDVRDNGIGVPEQNLGRLFTPFFTTSVEAGKGLGLATTRKIIDEHGGDIVVRSTEGKGTVFTVELPLAGEEKPPVMTPGSVECEPLTILAIDDLEATVMLLQDALEHYGHKVVTASSGEKGLEILNDNRVDLVICDLAMPGINGWEVGKTIKGICEERGFPKPLFIMLTGWGEQAEEKKKMADSGVDAVIEKPVDITRLLAVIRDVVEHGLMQ